MRLALALLATIAANAAALDLAVDQPDRWYDPAVSHHGKHGLGGVVLGAVVFEAARVATDDRATRYCTAFAAGAVVGIGYEVAHGSDATLIDPIDAAWVAVGSLVGAGLADLTEGALSIAPTRGGASLVATLRF
jgi:hypothetical protein